MHACTYRLLILVSYFIALLFLLQMLVNLPRYPPVEGCDNSTVHFVETAPSVFREVPWITSREYKVRVDKAGNVISRINGENNNICYFVIYSFLDYSYM